MKTIGERLRSERLRLGLSQEDFAAIGRLGRRTIGYYESNSRSPDAAFLMTLHNIGVDIGFVLIGHPDESTSALAVPSQRPMDASALAMLYRRLSDSEKRLFHALTGVSDGGVRALKRPRATRRSKAM